MSEHSDLRQKIDEAKRRLPMPVLLSRLGLGEHAKKTARCPFPGHEDKHPSFSVFKGEDGFWHFTCFSKCGDGDEIMLLSKLKGLLLPAAMTLYLDMSGFPASRSSKSREYPKCPESPMSLAYPVSPVSEGQRVELELKRLAMANACTCAEDKAEKKRFKLARDLAGLELEIPRKLTAAEFKLTCDEWERLSMPFLAWEDEDHLAMLVAEVTKVRVPTGEGDTLNKALQKLSELPDSDLPMIPDCPHAPRAWRRLAGLHREMSRLCDGKVYFLSYRDAAKACSEVSPALAHRITLALERFGVIKIVSKGKAGLNSRKAAEFRYLLPLNGEIDAMDSEEPAW